MKQSQKVAGLLLHDAVSMLKRSDKRIAELEKENEQLKKDNAILYKQQTKIQTRGM
jgi:hypothetical protein